MFNRFLLRLLFIALAIYFVSFPFVNDRILNYLETSQQGKLFGYIFQMLLGVIVLSLFSVTGKYVKILFGCFLLLNSVGYLTFFYATGKNLTLFDFITLYEAKGMISDAFSGYYTSVLKSLLMHLPLILVYFSPSRISLGIKATLGLVLMYVVILALLVSSLVKSEGQGLIGRPSFLLPTVQGFLHFKALSSGNLISQNFVLTERADYTEFIVGDSPVNYLLLVIDESVNWDLIDLNADLNVTPILKDFPDNNVINFGKTVSYANCSDITNVSIRKFIRYGQEEADLYLEKRTFIWEIARVAGFTPILLDVQRDGKGHNYFTEEELEDVEIISVTGLKDPELITVIDDLITERKNEKLFFFVIKSGAHAPYMNSFGFEEIFSPVMKNSVIHASTPLELNNSYKNRARFQTNGFFENALKHLPFKDKLAIIYTSDHGQASFYNFNKMQTHCNTSNPDPREGVVPMFVIGPEKGKDLQAVKDIFLSEKSASHYLVPAILMSYMGYNDQDIEDFTEYKYLLDKDHFPSGFLYQRAIPAFATKAERYFFNEEDLQTLSSEVIE